MKNLFLTTFLFLLIFYLPFINKPVHIDDHNFIYMSEAIDFPFGVTPGYEYYFMGSKASNYVPFYSSHPPFIPYFIKIIRSVSGSDAEYIFHTIFLVFPIILFLAIYGIAYELDLRPFPLYLFIIGNMAFLPVSHNLMADGPMFSLWMMSAYLLISGISKGFKSRIVLSSVFLAFAMLISYQTVFLLPAFLIYFLLNKKLNAKKIVAFLMPVIVIALFLVYVGVFYSSPLTGIINEIKRGLAQARLFNKALSIVINVGITAIFMVPLCFIDVKSLKRNLTFFAIAFFIILIPVLSLSYAFLSSIWLMLLASSGLFFILYITRTSLKEAENRTLYIFFLIWFYAVLFYNIFLMPFGALRYMLPMIAPAAFILLKSIDRSRAVIVSAVLTAILGLALAYGDYIFASSYRDFAREVKEKVGAAGSRVWYTGEWGMHYYMQKAGFRYLTSESNEPQKGDLIMMAGVPKLWGPSLALYQRMRLIDVREVRSWYPLRVMGLDIKAGYYSTLWGYQPFTISNHPVERFGIFRVIR